MVFIDGCVCSVCGDILFVGGRFWHSLYLLFVNYEFIDIDIYISDTNTKLINILR